MPLEPHSSGWYLEGYLDGERSPRRYPITVFPCRIGRKRGLEASVRVDSVSALHAELYLRDGVLWLRDLNSRNGTFVNRRRISGDVQVSEGDILHFAVNEFALRREPDAAESSHTSWLPDGTGKLSERLSQTARLRNLLEKQSVVPHFEPVARLGDSDGFYGFEVLGRGAYTNLPALPTELFGIAEGAGLEIPLSALFRKTGLEAGSHLPGRPLLFVNCHPSEMGTRELLTSLEEVRRALPDVPVVLETHEKAVQTQATMRELRAALTSLNMGLAYDDFGAGQARLLELVKVPPDYLKFDISLIHDIDRAPPAQRNMLQMLVQMVRDMGIACLAEGVERRAELAVCHDLGFEYAQGYFIGRPAPLRHWWKTQDSDPTEPHRSRASCP